MLGQAYTIAKSCLVPNKYYAILTVVRYGQMEASELVSIHENILFTVIVSKIVFLL